MIAQRYPDVEVIGSNYPLSPMRQNLAALVSSTRNLAILVGLGGDAVFQILNMPVPAWYTHNVTKNRMGILFGAWFFGNLVNNQLTATHAFEIYADGKLLFSKLDAGRLPEMSEFWLKLKQALGPPTGMDPARIIADMGGEGGIPDIQGAVQ